MRGLLVGLGAAAASGCSVGIPNEGQPQGCFLWDLSGMANHTYTRNTSTCPKKCNKYLVNAPCQLASAATCKTGAGSDAPATAYQVSNSDGSCYPLGDGTRVSFAAMDPGNLTAGIIVSSSGGEGGRSFIHKVTCGQTVELSNVVESPALTYTVTWTHPAGCPKFEKGQQCPAPVTPPPPPPPPYSGAKPTAAQLAYARSEIRGLVHFNMATYAGDGDPGCNSKNWNSGVNSSNPATFNPVKVDPSAWMTSMQAMGMKNFVITAKHGCGHLLWPTKTKLPGGAEYTYCVGKEHSAVHYDLLQHIKEAANKAGISMGFYYSLTNNYFMNVLHLKAQGGTPLPGQVSVTQAEFEAIALSQLSEIWSGYGNLTELWFDGTYPVDMHEKVKSLLKEKQPNAAVFNGLGYYSPTADNRITDSPVRWIGTESGLPGGDIWSTASEKSDYSGRGDPNSPVWAPAGCDFSIQDYGRWFWTPPSTAIRSLSELIDRYHATVGRNCVIEMDFAIGRDGLVDPVHAQRYQQLGDWIHSCYGGPPTFAGQALVNASGVLNSGDTLTITVPAGASADRLMIQEDQSEGQRIRSYTVEVASGTEWADVSSGSSVGNKRIDLLQSAVAAGTTLRLTVTAAAAYPVYVSNFAAFAHCGSG